jgi:hypothetical protein
VINGFRVEVTSDEIVRHLDHRIRHHRDRGDECLAKAKGIDALQPAGDDDDEQVGICWPGYQEELQRRAQRHRNRETLLLFFRERVLTNEIYLLSEPDLRWLEWLPGDEMTSLRT